METYLINEGMYNRLCYSTAEIKPDVCNLDPQPVERCNYTIIFTEKGTVTMYAYSYVNVLLKNFEYVTTY